MVSPLFYRLLLIALLCAFIEATSVKAIELPGIDCRWLGYLAEQSVLLIQENPEVIINVMTEEEQKIIDEAKTWHGSALEFRKKIILECKGMRI